MPTDEEISEIKRRATPGLLRLPGVTAVGIGGKEVAGRFVGELAIKVFVREKKPPAELTPEEMIPAEIEGVPTDVVLGGDLIYAVDSLPSGAVVDPMDEGDGATQRPLVGGTRLMVKDGVSAGTIGCFVQHRTNPNLYYVLTNNHVCSPPEFGPATPNQTRLGSPSGGDSCTKCCSDIIGTFVAGKGGPPYANPDHQRDRDRDEALVRLDPGTQFRAEIMQTGKARGFGLITGTDPVVHKDPRFGTYQVMKRGARTQLTGGVLSSFDTTTTINEDLLVIKPNPVVGAGKVFFIFEGDSGAALVNTAGKVIGLLSFYDPSGNAYAYVIDKVFQRLEAEHNLPVKLVTATQLGQVIEVPKAASVAMPPELARELSADPAAHDPDASPARMPVGVPWPTGAAPPDPAEFSGLQADLESSEPGRLLIRLWLRHQRELLDLVNGNRRVTVAWYRSGGSALFQLLIRMPGRPEATLPHTINEVPLAQCVDRMESVITRYASATLRRDMAEAQAALPDVAELAGLTYPQIIDALGRA